MYSGMRGGTVEIPACLFWMPNPFGGTMAGGEFDWGGRLPKGNGGAPRLPQPGWKSGRACKGIRQLDCEADKPSRYESRI